MRAMRRSLARAYRPAGSGFRCSTCSPARVVYVGPAPGRSLQHSGTTIEQLTDHDFPALHEDHVRREVCMVFVEGISRPKHKSGTTSGR
jgi:hypothetical protein